MPLQRALQSAIHLRESQIRSKRRNTRLRMCLESVAMLFVPELLSYQTRDANTEFLVVLILDWVQQRGLSSQ